MLKTRVITALILAPLTIAAILYLPPDGFALVFGLVVLAAAYEWSDLAGLVSLPARLAFVLGIFAVLALARIFAMEWAPGELPAWFFWPVIVWWALWAMAFRKIPDRLVQLHYPTPAKLMAGALVLISGWVMLVWLRLNFFQLQVLYLVVLIAAADIAAYFFGKRWGRTRLVESISPGKTVEGVYGALLAAGLLAVAVGLYADMEAMTLVDFVFLSLLTVAFSVSGDLFESLAKRIRGVKDSSGLLPGHGGLLDRVDSLLAGVSVFYVGSLLIPIFLFAGEMDAPIVLSPEAPDAIEVPAVPGEGMEEGHPAPREVPLEPGAGATEEPHAPEDAHQ